MFLTSLTRFRDFGLLLLRLGLAAVFLYNARHLMFDGPEKWKHLGAAMKYLGVTAWPAFWGLLAAFSEFFGAILIAFGFLFRPACLLLAITMTVAAIMHLKTEPHDAFQKASWAIDMAVVFWSLILIGPGKFSVDKN